MYTSAAIKCFYYVMISVSQLTNNYDRADSNGRVGEDEVGFTMSL